jgi:N-acetyl-anhydromuramyl-L-alanine amidase AmpD
MEVKFKQTPNVSNNFITPKGIVLHHTGGSYKGSVSWCLNPISKVSYHCIVDINGDRTILAEDTKKTWHAGISIFKGVPNCNNYLLGIAVSGDTNKRDLTNEEIKSVALWCVDKMKYWGFGIDMITTHREISPNRKIDVSFSAEKQIKDKINEILDTTYCHNSNK